MPVRQWVLTQPFALRFAVAFDREPGAVVFVQRIGGALNLNVHFHALVLDEAYATESSGEGAAWPKRPGFARVAPALLAALHHGLFPWICPGSGGGALLHALHLEKRRSPRTPDNVTRSASANAKEFHDAAHVILCPRFRCMTASGESGHGQFDRQGATGRDRARQGADRAPTGRTQRPAEPTSHLASEVVALLAVLALALWLRLGDFNEPFTGNGWQHLSARLGIMGRNYAEAGYATTHFAPAADPVPPADGRWMIYLNHPPLVNLVLSFAYLAFGVHEWSGRLAMVTASLGALLALWALTRRLFGAGAALAAAAFAAAVPMTAFYGSQACENGSLLLFFVSLSLLLYVRQLDRPTRGGWCVALLALMLAAATDWQGYLLMAVLAGHQLWLGRGARAASIGGALLVSLALYGALVLAAKSVSSGASIGENASMLGIFWSRSWGGLPGLSQSSGLSVAELLAKPAQNAVVLFTVPVLALAAVGLLRLRTARHPSLPILMLLFAACDFLVFVEGVVRHEFWIGTLSPAVFVLAGAGAAGLLARLRPGALKATALVALAAAAAAPGALATRERFESIRDDYFHTLGIVIEQHTRPGDIVGTCELESNPLMWYARRRVIFALSDSLIPEHGLPDSLGPGAAIVIPERMFAPHDHERLLRLLGEAYACDVVPSDCCGPIHIFDLRRPLR